MEKSKREPEQRLILGDEAAEKPKRKPEHALMQTLGFTEEDLEANREGRMSERQRDYISQKRNMWLLGSLLLILAAAIIWLGTDNTVLRIATGVAIIFAARACDAFHYDLRKGIASLEGRVSQNISGRRFNITVQNQTFFIEKRIFLAFKNGDPYVIYFAPHSKTILSAEWLREE